MCATKAKALAKAQYSVGIDLGTTHTVVAYAAADDAITVFAIPQLVSPGAVHALPLLPSVRYHAAPGELADADLTLPWDNPAAPSTGPVVIGQLARTLGAQVPQRLVSSAKSWLSHTAVDRTAAFLPWGAPPAPHGTHNFQVARWSHKTLC
jgi:molecular chaperone DnaK (HSP70)